MANTEKSYYTIVGQKTIRPHSEYNVSITSNGYEAALEIDVGISGKPSGKEEVYRKSQIVKVEPETTQLITFKIEDLIADVDYKLFAKGISGVTFESDVELGMNSKKFGAFIQTDKSMYKPSDCVKFRVVFLDKDLKGVEIPKNCNVFITDANEYRVKQWKNAEIRKGVFTNTFQLSDDLNYGNWTIHVEVGDFTHIKIFEVQEYVLPKFEVRLETPQRISMKDDKLVVALYSKYTNGQSVKGDATVSLKYMDYSSSGQMGCGGGWGISNEKTIIKKLPIDGKAVVEYSLAELNAKESHIWEVTVEASVVETLTETELNCSKSTVQLCQNRYELKLSKPITSYIDGMSYESTVCVQNLDGSPVQDMKNPVRIYWQYQLRNVGNDDGNFAPPQNDNQTLTLDENGMASTKITVPQRTDSISYTIKYLDEEQTEYVHRSNRGEDDKYIQVNILTETPTIDKPIEIEVLSTESLNSFAYQVHGRGNILLSETIRAPDQKKVTLTIQPTFDMVPNSKFIAFFVTETGKYVYHVVDLTFPAAFRNPVDIQTSKLQVGPGEPVDISVKTNANSFLGLLGIDQSVSLLKSGNDLNSDEILESLEEYSRSSRNSFFCGRGRFRTVSPFLDMNGVLISNTKTEEVMPICYMARGGHAMLENLEMAAVPQMMMMKSAAVGIAREAPEAFDCQLGMAPMAQEKIIVRKDFPETWIFEDVDDVGPNGEFSLTKKVPDTMTSWMISGFSVDPIYGFGMTKTPRKLEVFQPFFVSLKLPYSIKRGEILSLPVVVFNYTNDDVQAHVTLDNSLGEFEFIEKTESELSSTKLAAIKSNNGSTVHFLIRPRKVGHITIKVIAASQLAGDGVERQLLVEPEGVTQFVNKGLFVDLRESSKYSQEVLIEVPTNVIPDSTRITFSGIGDILGSTITNLDKLIKMPYGCGEQNMLNFVPNIVVLDYLTLTNKLTAEIKSKSIKYMEQGYQRELSYKHPDGSYSAFGPSGYGSAKGSTWLTAFVAKSFRQAQKYIDIEENIIDQAFDFLSSTQSADGSFVENGTIFHKDMQGGSGSGLSLTAYIITAFLQSQIDGDKYKSTVEKALTYVVSEIKNSSDSYALALCAYVLQLAKHSASREILEKLQSKSEKSRDLVWWEKPMSEAEKLEHFCGPKSVNIELTAYAMLAYIENDLISETIPIMKWLIGQRNEDGGFVSTQDTVVGIGALAKIAGRVASTESNISMVAKYNSTQTSAIIMNKENEVILQSCEIPSEIRKVVVEASGKGFAVAQISYKYNVEAPFDFPRFQLRVIISVKLEKIELMISANYVPRRDENDLVSNMAVMEVKYPSGYVADPDDLIELKKMEGVKKVETKDSDTIVFLYFDNLDEKPVSVKVCGMQQFKVENQKPSPISVYDYYDNSRRARLYYTKDEVDISSSQ